MAESDDAQLTLRLGAKSPRAFRTIAEVAEELAVPQHVLRFWESKFPQVRPLKRRGGRRYYRPEDVTLLRRIQSLLYSEGYTIRGAQKHLRDRGARGATGEPPGLAEIADQTDPQPQDSTADGAVPVAMRASLRSILGELEAISTALAALVRR